MNENQIAQTEQALLNFIVAHATSESLRQYLSEAVYLLTATAREAVPERVQ